MRSKRNVTTLLVWLAISIAVMLAGLYVWGLTIPAQHTIERSRLVLSRSSHVAAAVRDVKLYPTWRKGVVEALVLEEIARGVRYREVSRSDTVNFELVESMPGVAFTSRILSEDLPYGGTWTITLAARPLGTDVTIREIGTIKPPLFRVFVRHVLGLDATVNGYLDDLVKLMERANAIGSGSCALTSVGKRASKPD